MIQTSQIRARENDGDLEWVTPDDFLVSFTPADLGSRLTAFLADCALLSIATIAIILGLLAMVWLAGGSAGEWILAVVILVHFLLWNAYWIWFEWRRMGMTIGKRRCGIQVIRAGGGELTLAAVLARSLTREAEIWMPGRILLAMSFGHFKGGEMFLWCLAFLLIPFLNKAHRRLGDFVAGTVVVNRPEQAVLTRDVIAIAPVGGAESAYFFTTDMLDTYGTLQLCALQEILEERLSIKPSRAAQAGERQLLIDIKSKICHKLNYPKPVADEEAPQFLQEFYKAMREYLEGQLASGRATMKKLKKTHDGKRGFTRWLRRYTPPE